MRVAIAAFLLLIVTASAPAAPDRPSKEEVRKALASAVAFYRSKVSAFGGYVWQVSDDLSKREGEGRTGSKVAWVQPPGTPTVGEAYLHAYRLTGDAACLAAAKEVGAVLRLGQLRSGGWGYAIDFDRIKRSTLPYRIGGSERGTGLTVFDDDTTQSALRFMMRLDRALEFRDSKVHEVALTTLKALVRSQYPNGAWPQAFERPYDPSAYPVLPASIPETWSRRWTRPHYRGYYTLNDNVITDLVDTMILAARIYDRGSYRQTALKAGEFLLAAQLPDPQPGWAQQYDEKMQPAWARRFEPPAVSGSESRGVIRTLFTAYRATGEKRWIETVPKALDYFAKSVRKDGKLARFYELSTNRPLYFTRKYDLTYDDSDLPTHYAFVVGNWVPAARKEYEHLIAIPREKLALAPLDPPVPPRTDKRDARVAAIVAALDDRGAWVEDGRLRYHGKDDPTRKVIRSATFATNLRLLAEWLAAAGD